MANKHTPGYKLEGDMGDIVSLQTQIEGEV